MKGDCDICANGKLPSDSATCVDCGLSRKNYKPINNYDRLISKTPEELAMWMRSRGCPTEDINESCMNNKTKEKSCTRCWLDWLKAPREVDK